jgi:hypothetical protein
MPTRRQFMRHAIVSSVTVCSPAAPAMLAAFHRTDEARPRNDGPDEPYQFFRVLFDNMSPEGAAFGTEAAAYGAATRAVGADLGSLWMYEIEPTWKYCPSAIAGLTSGTHLFCLELLARDYGMGLVYRVRHEISASDDCRHLVTGPAALSSWTDQLAASRRDWTSLAASLAMNCPSAIRAARDLDLVDLASCSAHERTLFSWVIAPIDGAPGLRRRRS